MSRIEDDELLMEEELKIIMPMTEDEIEEMLEKEVSESLSYDFENREKAFEVQREIKDGKEKVFVRFNKARGEDAYEYLSEREKEEYYLQNAKLITHVASQYVCEPQKLFLDELEGWATVGFVKALNSYKLSYSASFTTYAVHCMKNEIKSRITYQESQVREVSSLDENVKENDTSVTTYKDMVEADIDVSKDVENNMEKQAVALLIKDLDKVLNPKEVFMVMSYYGFDGFTQRSQVELGMIFHVTQSAIAYALKDISKKLKGLYLEKFAEVSQNSS